MHALQIEKNIENKGKNRVIYTIGTCQNKVLLYCKFCKGLYLLPLPANDIL